MPTRNVNGAHLSYTERGSGPPVVLLHGFPLDARMWAAQLEALSSKYRVIAIDLQGFGGSRPSERFTMESLADDIHALLQELGALPCVLAGLSMGGYVALAYAKRHPADLSGLVLIDTKAEGDTPAAREGRHKMIELVRTSGSPAVAEQMIGKMLSPETLQKRPEQVKALRTIMEQCPPETVENALQAMLERTDQTCNLPSIPVPTLIIVGEADAITPPAVAQVMRDSIPAAQMIVIPGAGHMSPMEQPDLVNRALREFLDKLPSGKT